MSGLYAAGGLLVMTACFILISFIEGRGDEE
jgi:hypothetical protein